MKIKKFISIDPSLKNTAIVKGWIDGGHIILDSYEISVTQPGVGPKAQDTLKRCKQTINMINRVIRDWSPDVCFGEYPSGSKSSAAMKSYGVSCCYLALLPAFTGITPNEVKKVVGIKNASKDEVMDWAVSNFPDFGWERKKDGSLLKGRMEHVADSVAIAVGSYKKYNERINK